MKPPVFPKGWDERRISELLAHYEAQTEGEIVAEDETIWPDLDRSGHYGKPQPLPNGVES